MVSGIVLASTLLAWSVHAFKDASPFVALSTKHLSSFDKLQSQDEQVAQASQITSVLSEALLDCPSDAYIFVSQPGLLAGDFRHKSAVPYLKKQMRIGDDTKSAITIPEVAHQVKTDGLRQTLETKCGVTAAKIDSRNGYIDLHEQFPQLVSIDFAPLPEDSSRAAKLNEHDSFLNTVIKNLDGHSHTIIYTSTPPDDAIDATGSQADESMHHSFDFDVEDPSLSALHQDMRRDTTGHLHAARQQDNSSSGNRPLFETYNFLSPGIFMSILVGTILLSILSVGMSALGSLKVSYMAFSKEMGPAAQRKQQ